ncbi:MAG: phenylalanine--tRNA ligase subunit beta [Candidatus Buchananbacteria bacterium CG10_big_fil_rev_8_21_14_0_10_42_9]|uniref:Phenylalanine--tRNA ligase beta subunit n=1 Tax=Candidatus Buchananbacteria bacterium CG10_big_fil_rev_8_21_14_0_10_42_9 TaxID=1974526 RepID=A0A2H0W2P5_9BACT|nr:MAG: phenylalanine--tRNA ligase subunit beta [Candidatus Buchananbacteria bacterium CG10_big_fil_rev_8_21_14_0_10_42_9]
MKVSLNWIKDFTSLPRINPVEVAEKITTSIVEVEGVLDWQKKLKNIVIGKVEAIRPHPQADKLQLADVTDGKKTYQVVCGGSNLREGMLCVLAKVGAEVLWHGEGDPVKLESAEIRGQKSDGMICTSAEIELEDLFPADDERVLVDLSAGKYKVGQNLADALDLSEPVLDIDNKSLTNRPDLWGHYGLARELAAVYEQKLKSYSPKTVSGPAEVKLSVHVKDKVACPRYSAVVVDGIKVKESPTKIKQRLVAAGMRPINNIVDITNYVMLELGQPMHAFDARQVHDREIVVRKANNKEAFTTLDDKTHTLSDEDLLICDSKGPIALAGIMGGANSEIQNDTTQIILESANFEKLSVRKTAARLGIRTESSARFEKGLDPAMTDVAMARAVELILDVCPGAKVVSEVVDVDNSQKDKTNISVSAEFINLRIGTEIETKKIVGVLERLGFEVKQKKNELDVMVPSWRATGDVSIPEDIVEEVARLCGYENVPRTVPQVDMEYPPQNKLRQLEWQIRDILSGVGFFEVKNYSLYGEKQIAAMRMKAEDHIKVKNELAADQDFLRTTLIPGIIQSVAANERLQKVIKVFEVGQTFNKQDGEFDAGLKGKNLPRQPMIAAIALAGKPNAFIELKGVLELIFNRLGYIGFVLEDTKQGWYKVMLGKSEIGALATFPDYMSGPLGCKSQVTAAEVDVSALIRVEAQAHAYKPLPEYPSSERDLAIVVAETVSWGKIRASVTDPLLESVEFLNSYQDDKIGVGKKSIAFRMVFRSPDRTLKAEEIDAAVAKILKILENKVKATQR